MARTEFFGSQSGDDIPREGVAANGGSGSPDLGAIDFRLSEIEAEETEVTERTGSRLSEQRGQTVPEPANEPRDLLSESTDLNALMAAILGDEPREHVALEPAAQSRPVEPPHEPSEVVVAWKQEDAVVPWKQELETLLSEQPRREVAAPRAPAPPLIVPDDTGRFSALTHLSEVARRWLVSRVSFLVLLAVAGMTLGVLAWQSVTSNRAVESSTPSPAVSRTAEPTSATLPGSGVSPTTISTGATTGSPFSAGVATKTGSESPRVSSATSGNITGVRSAPARPAEIRAAAPAPSRRAGAPTVPGRSLASAPAPETPGARETTPIGTETVKPSQPTMPVASSVAEPLTTSASSAAAPAAPVTVGGAAAGAPRVEPPAVAPSVVVQRTEPRLLRRVLPEYPSPLRRAKVGGSVTVTMTVDAQGRVVSARSISGPNLLRPAAETAAQRWQYAPATMNGAPVESNVNVTFTFDPSGAPLVSR